MRCSAAPSFVGQLQLPPAEICGPDTDKPGAAAGMAVRADLAPRWPCVGGPIGRGVGLKRLCDGLFSRLGRSTTRVRSKSHGYTATTTAIWPLGPLSLPNRTWRPRQPPAHKFCMLDSPPNRPHLARTYRPPKIWVMSGCPPAYMGPSGTCRYQW